MINYFAPIINRLIQSRDEESSFSIPYDRGKPWEGIDDLSMAQALNEAFLICMTEGTHPEFKEAEQFLSSMSSSGPWAEIADFYINGIDLIRNEIDDITRHDNDFANLLRGVSDRFLKVRNSDDPEEIREMVWSVFFPEGNGIISDREGNVKALLDKRCVNIKELNRFPIKEPAREILLTSNVLLTVPSRSKPMNELPLSDALKGSLAGVLDEKQIYWYDHPIQIGVEQSKNEFLYGLKGLEEAFLFERNRKKILGDTRLTCLLSVSVTHLGLQEIAKEYLEDVVARSEGLTGIDLYIFTESDTRRILEEIIFPAAEHYFDLKQEDLKETLQMFGVDGKYGRHYSFLKAISAFWNILVDPKIRATFKIDLDQVFPQKELVRETGFSAFEHFKSPLWGAKGLDSKGRSLELGMIAGALVNEEDIDKSLFTPDILFPSRELSPDERIFFSPLTQALSTEAEMSTRYTGDSFDGVKRCIQRIHVTGGTNGILIDSLRRHRPFTPSFIGRAEDQAYIMSTLDNREVKLTYVHKDGLIMRHDKEGFGQEAIRSAYIAKLIGDYVRILYFSAYAEALQKDKTELKELLDPFTGCFISKVPIAVVYLRFAFKAASLLSGEKRDQGLEFVIDGSSRIKEALKFVGGEKSQLKQQYETEKSGWNLYYDTLSSIEEGLHRNDSFALKLKRMAEDLIDQCRIRTK